jgi:pyrroloquinoline quinone biosynthesis protein B
VSADYRQWFLLNASPDIRVQIESFPALHPRGIRDSPLQAVLLTDAELDHTLGLLLLREAGDLEVYATAAAHETLSTGTSLLQTLKRLRSRRVADSFYRDRGITGGGLSYQAFNVPRTSGRVSGLGRGKRVSWWGTESPTGTQAGYLCTYRAHKS